MPKLSAERVAAFVDISFATSVCAVQLATLPTLLPLMGFIGALPAVSNPAGGERKARPKSPFIHREVTRYSGGLNFAQRRGT